MAERRLSLEQYKTGILNGDRTILARAITLVESNLKEDESLASELIDSILSNTGNAYRIGVSGIPGAGKSTFLESLGNYLTHKGKKIAILAIDPSSKINGGSIMGDKTRMGQLMQSPLAFIRPTPSGTTSGGIAGKTYETILLCEAAGFEYIFIETVGVGQSETEVSDLADFFLLLMITGMGDELQTMKKGIMELANAIVITKADGSNEERAIATAEEIRQVLHLFSSVGSKAETLLMTCSAKENRGISEIAEMLENFRITALSNGSWGNKRLSIRSKKFLKEINMNLQKDFFNDPIIQKKIKKIENEVAEGKISPKAAAIYLLSNYKIQK
jgi:LAO/AO transport system kinase